MSTEPERLDLENGKYTIINDGGKLSALRYGQPWRGPDLIGDGLVGALFTELHQARAKLDEVHSWIVCSDIASPDDMMQSAKRIEEITRPSKS
jgi:hypothetical protein